MRSPRTWISIFFSIVGTASVAFVAYLLWLHPIERLAWRHAVAGRFSEATSFISRSPLRYDRFGRLVHDVAKVEVRCPEQGDKTAVILAIGQSNAANHSTQRYRSDPADAVTNYFVGACYAAASPLLGATGSGGESLTLLGSKLVRTRGFERVILIPLGVANTPISRWRKGGDLNGLLLDVVKDASKRYRITHVIWHQGEADAALETPAAAYAGMLSSLVASLRESGVSAPVLVSVTTRCGPAAWKLDNPVALAQRAAIDPVSGVRPGPDTDRLMVEADRYDGCHFNATGQEKFATALAEAISDAK